MKAIWVRYCACWLDLQVQLTLTEYGLLKRPWTPGPARGAFRYAGLVDGRLDACLFLSRSAASVPPRDAIGALLDRLSTTSIFKKSVRGSALVILRAIQWQAGPGSA
jgi:hypothetical protein